MSESEIHQNEMDTSTTMSSTMEENGGGCSAMDSGVIEDDRKLFVGGLPQDAKESDIKEHFGTFGEIENINLKTDPNTGRSRGFAFVVFKSVSALEAAVEQNHVIKSKKVAVKKAQAKQGKIYVGKLKPELSDEELKSHFSTYGTIANIEQPFDKVKNERKNFCFITYEKEEPAKKLLKEGLVLLNGMELEVKKVTPKPDGRQMGGGGGGFNGPAGGGGGGGGGGRGGSRGGQSHSAPWGGYGGSWGGYGDYWGGNGYGGGYGADPYYGGWGGYGGGWGGGYPNGGQAGGFAGGKTPRGGPRGGGQARGGGRGGGARGASRQKPY